VARKGAPWLFVSGDAVRVRRSDPLYNYSLAAGERPAVGAYEGIIAAPLGDWDAGGIPLGVVYVTLAAMDGRLFGLPPRTAADPTGQTLDDLFEWLHLSVMGALSVLRKMGRTGLGRQRLHPCYTLAGMAHLHPSCDAASSHKNLTSGPKMARQGAICSGTMQ
jgi:hypothetical protein